MESFIFTVMVDNAAEKNDNKNITELRLLEKTKYVPSLYSLYY